MFEMLGKKLLPNKYEYFVSSIALLCTTLNNALQSDTFYNVGQFVTSKTLQKGRQIGEVGRVILAIKVLKVKAQIICPINIFCYWPFELFSHLEGQ